MSWLQVLGSFLIFNVLIAIISEILRPVVDLPFGFALGVLINL
jgi:hypothetical protein